MICPQIGRQRRRNPRTNANAEDLFGRRRLAQTKTVLVIRVVASDTEVASTEEQIAEDVFGGEVTLGSQYTDCSYGELNFVATSDHNDLFGDDGVMTVAITQQANGTTRSSLKNEAISTAEDLLEADLEDVADHIMICLPPGSSGDWIAYVSEQFACAPCCSDEYSTSRFRQMLIQLLCNSNVSRPTSAVRSVFIMMSGVTILPRKCMRLVIIYGWDIVTKTMNTTTSRA